MSAPQPSLFTFIGDDEFRAGLDSDYVELMKAVKDGLWKSAHVLAGSIIEAILIDCLLAIKYKGYSDEKILKLEMFEAIDGCKEVGILTDQTFNLCTVVRQYRNLIHPGRVKRLSVDVDEQGATVAQALVKMVVKDVITRKKDVYGYTADLIIGKLRTDP